MARDFLSLPSAPYKGSLGTLPIDRSGKKGTMLRCNIKWSDYGAGAAVPNLCVVCDVNASGPNSAPQQLFIQSVYIDNLGVDFPVYVYFSDTQFPVACPPNTGGWFSVFTNQRRGMVCATGVSNNSRNQITKVFFANVDMVPYIDQESPSFIPNYIGSLTSIHDPSISLSPGFGPPALGDQTYSSGVDIATPGTIVRYFGFGPYVFPNNLYVTQLQGRISGAKSAVAGGWLAHCILNNDLGFTVVDFFLSGGDTLALPQICYDLHGNLRYNGQLNWFLTVASSSNVGSGTFELSSVFSVNPK